MHFLVSKSFHLLLVFSSLLLFFQPAIFSNEDPVIDLIDFSVCSDATLNYTSGSQFETNLDRLLPKLSPDGPIDINGYYNTTSGEDPNIVYGYSQCMSGATEEECRACLKNSTVEIIRSCPNRKQGIIRYYRCILRYSYQPFFAQSQIGIKEVAHRDQNASDPAVFNQQLGDLMRDLTSQASSKPSRYATGTVDLNSFDNINGLAQCTRDLSTTDCTGCLRAMIGSIPSCCANRTGGIAFSVSCNIRYETYPFFNGFPETPPPSPLPLPASPPPSRGTDTSVGDGNGEKKKKKKNSRTVVIAVVTVVVAVGVITSICACLWMRRKAKRRTPALEAREGQEQIPIMKMESMLFDFSTLEAATANFSDENKLGQGGFGPVYKGKLFDGRDIAVKRLSRTSVQGMEELRNEVELVAKLQHRNLVRLWGCCLEHHEKLLVYEYVPNTSLDRFLFDPIKRLQLKWDTRYNIIRGIARGLLYLHEDSLLRIIHRDLKASNILLDGDMNPKIADFGLARLFGADQTEDNTSRIAGTYGYMSPEYLAFGNFSTKSDVFSFGVLVLEIVTGRKSTSFHNSEGKMNLQTYVWQHWTEETVLEIMDQTIAEECSTSEVFRCIHMGLLCMEEEASVRPTMSMVVLMLNSQSLSLPSPSLPAYLVGESRFGSTSVSTSSNSTRSRSK